MFLLAWWHIALRHISPTFKKVFFNLFKKVLASAGIRHIEAILVNQHCLLF